MCIVYICMCIYNTYVYCIYITYVCIYCIWIFPDTFPISYLCVCSDSLSSTFCFSGARKRNKSRIVFNCGW